MPVLSWWVFSETNKNPVWSVCPVLGYSRFFGEVAEWVRRSIREHIYVALLRSSCHITLCVRAAERPHMGEAEYS
jgi:hypothetical protein